MNLSKENQHTLNIAMDTFEDLEQYRDSILGFCQKFCRKEYEIDIIEMAILEVCHNAIRHGYKRKNNSVCELGLLYDNQSIRAIVKSYGKEFLVEGKDKFSIEQDFLQYSDGNLGIPLIKSLMDSVEYLHKPNNLNEIIMVKKIT